MPDSMSFDFSDLTKLAADLGEVPKTAGPFINSAIQRTSGNIEKAASASVSKGGKRWRPAAVALDYELTVEAGFGGSSITSEVGYNKDKDPGKLGNLREFGAPGADGVPLPPHNDLLNALHENEKDLEVGLDKALQSAERKAGL